MGVNLRPDENVIYPVPYEEGKFYSLIVTGQRVIQVLVDGRTVDIQGNNIKYLARGVNSTLVMISVVLLCAGLPFVGCGLLKWNSVADYGRKPVKVTENADGKYVIKAEGNEVKAPSKKQIAEYEEMKDNRVQAIVFVILGGIGCGIAYLLLKKRLTVVCGGQKRRLVFPMKDKMMQTQVMMTIQAVQSAAKAGMAQKT